MKKYTLHLTIGHSSSFRKEMVIPFIPYPETTILNLFINKKEYRSLPYCLEYNEKDGEVVVRLHDWTTSEIERNRVYKNLGKDHTWRPC